jgi:AcrR family transcriptional regulator
MKVVKQQRAHETREKILRAAAHLFALKGYHDTKLQDVLDAAAVTKGAFFHHFRDREDLGFAVLDWHMESGCWRMRTPGRRASSSTNPTT